MPAFIADFLDLETSLRRRFREESVSDLLVAAIIRLADPNLFVFVPEKEKLTGNDFDLVIFDPDALEAIQYRIQAKRLKPHDTHWEISSYCELAHPKGTGTQSASLIRSAASEKAIKTIPLYAFYNPARTCLASGGVIGGLELASGIAIRAIVRELVKAKPKRPPLKRIGTLQPLFFPLTTILCPPSASAAARRPIPPPSVSYDAVSSAIDYATMRYYSVPPRLLAAIKKNVLSSETEQTDHPDVPLKLRQLPPILREVAERRKAEEKVRILRANVKRPRIVFVSEGPSRE